MNATVTFYPKLNAYDSNVEDIDVLVIHQIPLKINAQVDLERGS